MAMGRATTLALLLGGAGAALAQVPPAELGQRNVPAPWWLQQPVIASIGMVRTEVPAKPPAATATLQPPLRELTDQACVVYALLP